MKKANFAISILVSIMLLAPAGFGFAQSSMDLGNESTGLLPSNPFYFLKEWGRGFRKLLTFNPVNKTELELDVLNEKAAELEKLGEITPNNVSAITLATDNYKNAVEQLRGRLESLTETSQNPNIDKLLNQLTEQSLKHQKLFDDLQSKFETKSELKAKIDELKDKLAETVAAGFENLDTPEKIQERFQSVIESEKNNFKELRAAELVDRAEEKISKEEIKKAFFNLKDDLLIEFSGQLQGLELITPSVGLIKQVSGDRLRHLQLLDEIREKISNSDLKSELNVVRQKILEKAEEEKAISKDDAQQAIDAAQKLISDLETAISTRTVPVRASIKELLDRANFNVSQAEKLFEEENYGGAFGQATAASAAAKNALSQLTPTSIDANQNLILVKSYYDILFSRARSAGLTKEQNPKLFELFAETEQRIVDLTNLIANKAASEKLADAVHNIKLLLATIDQVINQTISPPESEATPSVPKKF